MSDTNLTSAWQQSAREVERDELIAEARQIIQEFEERAWDGDPLRREDDPLCVRARVFLAKPV